VTSQDHYDLALKGVEHSTILLKNFNSTLPLTKKKEMNILIMGNDAGMPITTGGGSGHIAMNYEYSPLWAMCDEFGIERINSSAKADRKCNTAGDCITYFGLPNTKSDAKND